MCCPVCFSFLGSDEDEEPKKPKKKAKKAKKETKEKEKKRTEDTGAKLGEIRDGKILLQAASNRREWFQVEKLERQLDDGVCLPVLLHKGPREEAIKVCPHPNLPGHGDHASTFSTRNKKFRSEFLYRLPGDRLKDFQ